MEGANSARPGDEVLGLTADSGEKTALVMTWGRIEARSYDEAVELLEKLSQHPSALIEDTERRWSIYVSAQASEFPTVIRSAGVDPERVEIVDPPLPFVVPAPGDDVASGRD